MAAGEDFGGGREAEIGIDLPVTDVLVLLHIHVVQLIDRNWLRRAWIVWR